MNGLQAIGQFLKLLLGCHGRADRSFFYKEKQFPICARCTGELVGIIFAIFLMIFQKNLTNILNIVIMLPMIIDGTVQLFTTYESNNRRRFITGFLFGIGFCCTIVHLHLYMVHFIREYLTRKF